MFINDEQKNDYIKLILNIYHYLKKWYESLKVRAANDKCEFKNKLIFDIKFGIWTAENEKIYKIKFTS